MALERGGRILMQQRPFASQHGGLWEFPGGKVEPGEMPEAAAVRELQEELGVVLAVDALEPAGFASGTTVKAGKGGLPRSLVILLYLCRNWRGEPAAIEAEAIGWYAPEAIAALAMPPLDYPLAAGLRRHLGSRFTG